MNRRNFLKAIAAAIAAPVVAEVSIPEFIKLREEAVIFTGEFGVWENIRFIESSTLDNPLLWTSISQAIKRA